MRSGWPVFFDHVRKSLFDGRLSQSQVVGLKALVAEGRRRKLSEPKIACVAATSFHETGRRMQPVREGFASSTAGAVRAVTRLYERGAIRINYALPDPVTGENYFGRGEVQLTWARNYQRMGRILGLPLYENPDLALQNEVSKRIIFEGMIRGTFTGKKLADYIGPGGVDFVGARRIINGTDKAELIAGYSDRFLVALRAGIEAQAVKPQEAPPPMPKPAIAPPDREIKDILLRVAAIEARQASAGAALNFRG